jgi:sulfite reductase alpha subunit
MKLETEEDLEALTELAGNIIDCFADNALEHERVGEMVDRIGLPAVLDEIGLEVDPNMLAMPRQSSYVRVDTWDEEAQKWFDRKAA